MVFTDLDGSLLDHHSYSYKDALPMVHRLERLGIPLIPVTSKTRSEIEYLRGELGNRQPFIVENGAAIFIPRDCFREQPAGTQARGDYWVRALVQPREHWLGLLRELVQRFPGEFAYFQHAGTAGIMAMTGLDEARAAEANDRGYSEPVKWLGTPRRREEFLGCLRDAGASVLAGGRFLAVSGDCDKGRALCWLRDEYARYCPGGEVHDLAIGDSNNDRAMLEAAGTALVVRSPVHDFPQLQRTAGVMYSTAFGPAGWAEGVARWLQGLALRQTD